MYSYELIYCLEAPYSLLIVICFVFRSPSELGTSSFGRETEALDSVTSLVGLLTKHCELAAMESEKDYRKYQKPGTPSYFSPLTPQTEKEFDESFCQAVGPGLRLSSVSLPVYGRRVIVPVASENGVARFSFNELCRSPLGPADYITICNAFHTVFLEDIPQMNIYQKNEARRFLSFVDAAYESKVKVFCTAASSPDELFQLIPSNDLLEDKMHVEMIGELAYDLQLTQLDLNSLGILTGDEEIFSFKRCISRLKEMQSEMYQTEKHRCQAFSPYLGTFEDRLQSENRRREREHKRRLKILDEALDLEDSEAPRELPLTPLTGGSSDWADEASYMSWSNDIMRKEMQDLERNRRGDLLKKHEAPKFSEEHFWGFGWWEKVMGRRRSKGKESNEHDDQPKQ